MKLKSLFIIALSLLGIGALSSCEDSSSPIGGSLMSGDVTITVDTLEMKIDATSILEPNFDSRAQSKLLGRINVPEYGSLECSFVTQLLPATKMNIPDSIKVGDVDSLRMVLKVPRGSLTGDSLAPQQLKTFRLTKQLPSDINSTFNPDGYYDPQSPLGVKSYTLSALSMNDSMFKQGADIRIPVMMPDKMAKDLFTAYRDNSQLFQWPQTFAQQFPGVYVQQNFGNGCVGVISGLEFYLYWHYNKQVYQKKDDDSGEYHYVPVLTRDSVCLLASRPEVLSANRVEYKVSDYLHDLAASGKSIVTTPGGYYVKIDFPAKELIEKYNHDLNKLAVVSKLTFEIPAKAVKNDYDLPCVPNLLMVKSSEREKFFSENKVPDNKIAFSAEYDSENECYTFGGMREYILDLINKGEITAEDTEFSLVPVILATETTTDYYGNVVVYVTGCAPYIGRPTMTELDTEHATIYFTYSRQTIE